MADIAEPGDHIDQLTEHCGAVWLATVGGHAWFPVRSIHTFLFFIFFTSISSSLSSPSSSSSSSSYVSSSSLQKLLPVLYVYTRKPSHSWVSADCYTATVCVCATGRRVVWNSPGQGLSRGPLTAWLATAYLPLRNGINTGSVTESRFIRVLCVCGFFVLFTFVLYTRNTRYPLVRTGDISIGDKIRWNSSFREKKNSLDKFDCLYTHRIYHCTDSLLANGGAWLRWWMSPTTDRYTHIENVEKHNGRERISREKNKQTRMIIKYVEKKNSNTNKNRRKPCVLFVVIGYTRWQIIKPMTDGRQFIVEGLSGWQAAAAAAATLDRPDAVMSEKSVLKTLPSFEKYHKILDWHRKK